MVCGIGIIATLFFCAVGNCKVVIPPVCENIIFAINSASASIIIKASFRENPTTMCVPSYCRGAGISKRAVSEAFCCLEIVLVTARGLRGKNPAFRIGFVTFISTTKFPVR